VTPHTGTVSSEVRVEDLEQHRRELTGYCYRMLGSVFDADDAVQETMVRAWRGLDSFEGRSAMRSWLYRIATNVCLDMLRGRQRRASPMDMGPSRAADSFTGATRPEHAWVQPIPDDRVLPDNGDPAELAATKETIRLAFVTALQHLPARQRAVLILRDVDAFERYDITSLVSLLHDEAVMTMPPFDFWLRGPDEMSRFFLGPGIVCRESRLVATEANGCAAFGSYKHHADGGRRPWAIQIIEVSGNRIIAHHNFVEPRLFAAFGLPGRLP